jgi:hypothetical protein
VQKRQLSELLIDRVIVTNEQIEIRYVMPTSPRGEQTRFSHLHTDYFGQVAITQLVRYVLPDTESDDLGIKVTTLE